MPHFGREPSSERKMGVEVTNGRAAVMNGNGNDGRPFGRMIL